MADLEKIVSLALNPLLRSADRAAEQPEETQRRILNRLIENGKHTVFGGEHRFSGFHGYTDFSHNVPVRDYNGLSPYIERLYNGEDYVLWNEKTRWFAKSSGTSSGKSKFIPVTPSNLQDCHYRGFKTLLATYLQLNPKSRLFHGKALTLGGSVKIGEIGASKTESGDLSAILLKNSPAIAEIVRTPPKNIAMAADFEEKIAGICKYCSNQNVTNFAGVPSWNLVLIEKLLEYNNAEYLTDIWPNVELFMHGGISFTPYKERFRNLIPSDRMHYIENYNASEGYFAFQNDLTDTSMQLALDNGVFFEFIPLKSVEKVLAGESDDIVPIEGVRTGMQYALVISTNSGLWRYLIGDCVEFTSIYPHKIRITGRTQLYINAFGEELMIHNAESALAEACVECGLHVQDYTVAPIFMDDFHDKGRHQWIVEFSEEKISADTFEQFRHSLDRALCKRNSDYEAKRNNNTTMEELQLTVVANGSFYNWMNSRGKIGGQHKVPRLYNDRTFADEILKTSSLYFDGVQPTSERNTRKNVAGEL